MLKINSVLNVNVPNFSYEIMIGENLLENLEHLIKENIQYKKCAVITNETIYNIYREKISIDAEYIILKDGEEYKNFDSYKYILDKLLELKLERSDLIVAIGGGVVGDIAGFAASTYLRGIRFVQVPTTLLAQVDSSVGGKVGINHTSGKNLIGAFWQPSLVVADISVLKTLDLRQLKTGLGEVLKYALIEKSCLNQNQDKYKNSLFEFLIENKSEIYNINLDIISELVYRCCELKASVVNKDEKEAGLRMILNYGHTFAHSIEKCTNYKKFTHGEAVGLGMKMALDLSNKMGLITDEYCTKSNQLIDDYAIGCKLNKNEISLDNLVFSIVYDKKVKDNKPRFILSCGEFECKVKSVDNTELIREIFKKYVD